LTALGPRAIAPLVRWSVPKLVVLGALLVPACGAPPEPKLAPEPKAKVELSVRSLRARAWPPIGSAFPSRGHVPFGTVVERRGSEATMAALATPHAVPLPIGFEIALAAVDGSRSYRTRKLAEDRWEFEEIDGAGVPVPGTSLCARCHAEAVRERLFFRH
jgi:hypothetical protein